MAEFATPILDKTYMNALANTDVPANRICVYDASNGGAKLATASTDLKFQCVSLEAEDSKGAFKGRNRGIAPVMAGSGGVTKGDHIEADSVGKGVTVSSVAYGGGSVKLIAGIAMSTAAAGELFDMDIQPQYHKP